MCCCFVNVMFKIAEKEKRVVIEEMKREGESENSLSGIFNPPLSSPCLNHRYHDRFLSSSSFSRASRQSDYSHSYSDSFSNGFDFSEDGSSETKYYRSTDYLTELLLNKSPCYSQTKQELVNDLGLPESFYRMHITDKQEEGTKIRGFDRDPDRFGLGNGSFGGAISWNFESNGQYEDFNNDPFDYEVFRSSNGVVPVNFDGDMRLKPLRFRQGYNVGDETGSCLTHFHSTSRDYSPSFNDNGMSYMLSQTQEQDDGHFYREVQLQNPISRAYYSGDFVCSQLHGMDSNGGKGLRGSLSSLQLNTNNPLHNSSLMKDRTKANPIGEATPVFKYKQCAGNLKGFSCEDSFIIDGQCLSAVTEERKSQSHKKNSQTGMTILNERDKSFCLDCHSPCGEIFENRWSSSSDVHLPSPLQFCSLDELRGYIYHIAKDQCGCRSLQTLFDEGTSQAVQIIFEGVIDHVVELSTNPFGNYLVQKLLDVCSADQKLQIVLVMTQEPGQLVNISVNTHG